MSLRSLVIAVALGLGGLAPGCADNPSTGLPGPGPTGPEQPCTEAKACGCWQCACKGVGGAPGAAQLCVGGKCPTGAEACAPVCAIVGATVETATAVDVCDGRP